MEWVHLSRLTKMVTIVFLGGGAGYLLQHIFSASIFYGQKVNMFIEEPLAVDI